jgi:hypothetical protein
MKGQTGWVGPNSATVPSSKCLSGAWRRAGTHRQYGIARCMASAVACAMGRPWTLTVTACATDISGMRDGAFGHLVRAAGIGLCAVSLGACGSSPVSEHERQTQAEKVVRRFLQATAKRDARSACAPLSDAARRDLAAYPYAPAPGPGRSSCEATVTHLDALPRADEWTSLAAGVITVSLGAGLDNSTFAVSYRAHGAATTATGTIQPSLGGGALITAPPTPPRVAARRNTRH